MFKLEQELILSENGLNFSEYGKETDNETKYFQVSYPSRASKHSLICKGCHKKFRRLTDAASLSMTRAYILHCIDQCEEYKKLNLIRECKACQQKFVHPSCLSCHLSNVHPETKNPKIRSWMNNSMLNRKCSALFNTTIDCKGCGRTFKCYRVGRSNNPELAFYIHCVEQCEDYKKLNLIQKCNNCHNIFLTMSCYIKHVRKCNSS